MVHEEISLGSRVVEHKSAKTHLKSVVGGGPAAGDNMGPSKSMGYTDLCPGPRCLGRPPEGSPGLSVGLPGLRWSPGGPRGLRQTKAKNLETYKN